MIKSQQSNFSATISPNSIFPGKLRNIVDPSLPPEAEGLLIDIYAFSKEPRWHRYNRIQADIIENMLTVLILQCFTCGLSVIINSSTGVRSRWMHAR